MIRLHIGLITIAKSGDELSRETCEEVTSYAWETQWNRDDIFHILKIPGHMTNISIHRCNLQHTNLAEAEEVMKSEGTKWKSAGHCWLETV